MRSGFWAQKRSAKGEIMSKYDIVCAGTAILDSIIRGFDPEPVSAAGYRAESGMISAGGDAVNESIASVKLGMKTAILCSLGNDAAGDIIEQELKRKNVITDLLIRSDEHATPVTTIFVAEDGNRRSITNGSHRYNFHPERYLDSFTDTKALIMGSLFRAPFNDHEVIRRIVSAAKEKGILVAADLKLPNFEAPGLDEISDLLPMIDFITPNEDESRFYTGKDEPEEMADVLLGKGARNVIIKLGSRGCFFKNRGMSLRIPAYRVDTVDATGAGDSFMAGLVSELIRGSDIKDALEFACACGALCSTEVGAGSADYDRAKVLSFMRDSGSRR